MNNLPPDVGMVVAVLVLARVLLDELLGVAVTVWVGPLAVGKFSVDPGPGDNVGDRSKVDGNSGGEEVGINPPVGTLKVKGSRLTLT